MNENIFEQELKIDGLSLEDINKLEEKTIKIKNKIVEELKNGLAERIKNNPNEILIKPDTILGKLNKTLKKIIQAI